MRHQELRLQRVEAKKVLGKFDELYDFIRNSGLHYKINENFGCTVITVGRNFHRYSDVYSELRAAPVPLESQTSLNLNLVISELESARQEAAFLKEEAQLKETVLEEELHRKTKIMEELEKVKKTPLMNLKKLQKNFSIPRNSVMTLSKVM
jgi:ATP sulfurylase